MLPTERGRRSFPHCREHAPPHLADFWTIARTAKLFEDTQYGQWGLEILTPQQAIEATDAYRNRRPRDFAAGDLVIGRFLGDSDLLMVRCDREASDFGSVLVIPPLDPRPGWDQAADSFADFLKRYAEAGGEKFWESAG